jgi:hypothetical protein
MVNALFVLFISAEVAFDLLHFVVQSLNLISPATPHCPLNVLYRHLAGRLPSSEHVTRDCLAGRLPSSVHVTRVSEVSANFS